MAERDDGPRRGVVPVAALSLALGLALRLLRLAERRGDLGPGDSSYLHPVLDAAHYDRMARAVLGLDGGPGGLLLDQPFPMAPLYGYFLAGTYALFGAEEPGPTLAVQAGLGAVAAAVAALLAGHLAPRSPRWGPALAAGVAGLSLAAWPVAVHYDVVLLGVALAGCLVALGTWLLVLARPAAAAPARPTLALAGGLLLGLAVTARANLLLALPLVALAFAAPLLRRGPGRARHVAALLAVLLGMAAPVGLSAAHNARAGGGLVAVSANGGVNLYMGNNPYVQLEPQRPFRLPAEADALARRATLIASREQGTWLDAAAADAWWRARVVDLWVAHPGRYLGLALRKLHQLLGPQEVGDNTDMRVLLAHSRLLSALPVRWTPLLLLALAGLPAVLRRPGAAPVLAVLLPGLGGLALFFHLSRYRVPLAPLVFALAGVGVVALLRLALARRWAALGLSAGGLAVAGALLSLPPLDPRLPWNRLADGPGYEEPGPCVIDRHLLREPAVEEAYARAKSLLVAGERVAARQALVGVLAADPGHAPAAVDLSALLVEAGDATGAAQVADAALALDPCDDKAWSNLGTARLMQGRELDAARAFKRAHALDPYSPEYEAAYGHALLEVGEEQQALALLEQAVRWGPELWQPRAVLGRRALERGEPGEAVRLLGEARALVPERPDVLALYGLALVAAGRVGEAQALLAEAQAAGHGAHVAVQALRRALGG